MTSGPLLLGLLGTAVGFIVLATTRWKLHPFLALLIAALAVGLGAGLTPAATVTAAIAGFGRTAGAIGVVIACGAIIGIALERSGGARVMADSVLRLVGARRALAGMSGTGAIVSVPVFCDSGFVLLSPLAHAIAQRSGTALSALASALGMGLYTTHCLIPPTPGPIAVAGELRADLGTVILLGGVVTLPVLVTTCAYARWIGARTPLPPSLPAAETAGHPAALPGPLAAFAPVVVPVALIAARSVAELPGSPLASLRPLLGFLGEPTVALLLGVLASLPLLRGHADPRTEFSQWCANGLGGAGTIILITAAGGAFGGVLRETALASVVSALAQTASGSGTALFFAFAIAAALKTALGSSTVAMITTASLFSPLLVPLGLQPGFGPALTTLAIASGAMVVSHVNDSFFWVITQLTHLTVPQGYRLVTIASGIAGVTGFVAVWALSLILS